MSSASPTDKPVSRFSDDFSWKTVPSETKKKYKDQAVEDVLRYKSDYEEYKKIEKVTVTMEQMFDIIAFSKTAKREADVLPKSGYKLFYRNFIRSMESQKDEMTLQELSTAAAKAWKQLTEEEKDVYRKQTETNLQT